MTATQDEKLRRFGHPMLTKLMAHAAKNPQAIALIVQGETWTYGELVEAARGIASQLVDDGDDTLQARTAIVVDRSISAYLGILAALMRGHAYVPLNAQHPFERNARILEMSGAQTVVCGADNQRVLQSIENARPASSHTLAHIICGDDKAAFPNLGEPTPKDPPLRLGSDDLAYIMFTSGSTGIPKGVPISLGNVQSYLASAIGFVDANETSRFSQNFDLSFDLSVHDLFVCWSSGATLVVPSRKDLRHAGRFIRDHELTHWFSVPSLAHQIRLAQDLAPASFPSLQLSMFCGEAMPTRLAQSWAEAAAGSRIENWYGPTEATIACSRFVFSQGDAQHEFLPLGTAFPRMSLNVLDAKGVSAPIGQAGELWLSGAQLTQGYLGDEKKTAESFVRFPDDNEVFYRSGDRAVLDDNGMLHFLGRTDHQVKLRGYRVELGEIEGVISSLSEGRNVVAFAWAADAETDKTVLAAIEGDRLNSNDILRKMAEILPSYMVPTALYYIDEFPQNTSGKTDRAATEKAALSHGVQFTQRVPQKKGDLRGQLIEIIRDVAPELEIDSILTAANLLDAGMDSLDFVNFTMRIEQIFNVTLDQDRVIALAELPFEKLVAQLKRGHDTGSGWRNTIRKFVSNIATRTLDKITHFPRERANRTLEFIHKFPEFLELTDEPLVIAIGSSGVF